MVKIGWLVLWFPHLSLVCATQLFILLSKYASKAQLLHSTQDSFSPQDTLSLHETHGQNGQDDCHLHLTLRLKMLA